MKSLKYLILLLAGVMIVIASCKDDDPAALSVSTIEAVGTSFQDGSAVSKDLNGSSAATDVALNSTITITFDRAVDVSTATSTNVTLYSDAGDVSAAVSGSGSSITVDPANDLERGTLYTLSMENVKASDGGALANTTRTFTTEGRAPVVVPKGDDQIAYWSFDETTDDQVGAYDADNTVALSYGTDRYNQGNSTASFDGDETIIEVPAADMLMEGNDITIAFWVKTNSTGHVNQNGDPASFFCFGLGAFFGFQFEIPSNFGSCKLAMSYELENGDKTGEDLWFNGSGEDRDNGGWQGWDFVADLTGSGGVEALLKDKWAHVVCTYNSETKKGWMFINGQLMKSQDFNLWPEMSPKLTVTGVTYRGVETDVEPILAFGFIKSIDSPMWADTEWGDYAKPTSNHFKGDLDDVRIFNVPYTEADALALYNAEKP